MSVQTVKGVSDLLNILKLLSDNKYHVPVCVSVYGRSAISALNPVASVRITNVLGRSLGSLSVHGESKAWTSKRALQVVTGDTTLYALNVLESKPSRGTYDVKLTVAPSKADARLIGTADAVVKLTVLTEVTVESAEIGIAERDQTAASKMQPLKWPATSNMALEADHHQKLLFKFTLKDKANGEILNAHQVFAQLVNQKTKQEIVFVAEVS